MGFFPSFFVLKCDKRTLSGHGVITPHSMNMKNNSTIVCHDDVTQAMVTWSENQPNCD